MELNALMFLFKDLFIQMHLSQAIKIKVETSNEVYSLKQLNLIKL